MTAQLPAHLQRYQARDIGTTLSHNLGSAAPPYVSIAGNRFMLIDAAGNEMPVPTFDPQIGVYLDACIVDTGDHLSRIYYSQKYDPSAATFNPPDCFSDNGVGPSIACSAPQARSCTPDPEGIHGCKWAVWGSATSAQGKSIPACQQVQKVALLVPGIPQTIFLLRVPPNSHKHLRAYVELSRGSGVNIADVVTRIYFDQTTQGTLLFKAVNYIDENTAVMRQSAYDEKKTDALVGRTDVARVPALAAPAQQQIAAEATHMPPPNQQFLQSNPTVTGPAPFVPPATAPVQTAQPAAPMATGAGFATQPASSTEQPAPGRRRRRTAAEMAQANGAAPVEHPSTPLATPGTGLQQAAAAPQAPFPHPGQQVQQPGPFAATPAAAAASPGFGVQNPAPPAATTSPSNFGIAQGQQATANPELAGMLDDFFKQG